MTTVACPQYEEALRLVSVEYGLKGVLNTKDMASTSDEVLFLIWRDAVSRLMTPGEKNRFLALPELEQREYFTNKPSFFAYARFRDEFLEKARRAKNISLN